MYQTIKVVFYWKGEKIIETIYKTKNGKLINGDNLEVLAKLKDNTVDNCISDFPYDLSFMGKKWDTTGNFYEWCKPRAKELYRVLKPGGYALIFGHPKTNHRMKCAFEDEGFNIVEEIDWIYFTGFPKNQDIGKMMDKKVGKERDVIGTYKTPGGGKELSTYNNWQSDTLKDGTQQRKNTMITAPSSDLAKQWDGWKTSGLKPAKEPITVFQKPLEGTYCDNIEKWNVGGMNIDACRIGISQKDIDMLNAKSSKNPTTNYGDKDDKIYGKYAKDMAMPPNSEGRFPPNIIFDEVTGQMLDEQTGTREGCKPHHIKSNKDGYKEWGNKAKKDEFFGYADSGGGSRFFYTAKSSPKEKKLSDGTKNPHVTVKPISLIKWLIKLVTPKDGITIDITAGSCTHGASCEELIRDEGYNIKWLNIEITNTEDEPYCDFAKKRLEEIHKQ